MKRILVVDDERSLRVMLEDLLSYDYEVTLASNGLEAKNLLNNASFDLLITDLVMPEMNGIELVMAIQKNHPKLKIIAMSGGGGITGRFDYLPVAELIGAEKILRKPFKLSEMTDAVRQTLM